MNKRKTAVQGTSLQSTELPAPFSDKKYFVIFPWRILDYMYLLFYIRLFSWDISNTVKMVT